jgi:hypothetical protein
MSRATRLFLLSTIASGLCFFLASAQLPAIDFIRGDANGDMRVSVTDVYSALKWLHGGAEVPCGAAMDVDDDGIILPDTDCAALMLYLFSDGQPPVAPFPEPGRDPTGLPVLARCDSYGTGVPFEDPVAKLAVLDATVAGGGERLAVITVSMSNGYEVGACSLSILDEAGVLDDHDGGAGNISTRRLPDAWTYPDTWEGDNCTDQGFAGARLRGGRIDVGVLGCYDTHLVIESGQDRPVVEVRACVKPGTAAGDYPLTLVEGELSHSSWFPPYPQGWPAVLPVLASGILHVEQDVTESACKPPPAIEDVHILFKLEDASVFPGSAFAEPFSIKVDRATSGFSYSIDFNEEILQATAARKLWQKPDGTPYDFERFEINNSNATPGSAGLDEGYLAGAAIVSLTDTRVVLPPGEEVQVIEFEFMVDTSAPAGTTSLAFVDGAQGSEGGVPNKIIAGGKDITPALASSFVFVNARINIIGDTMPFVRGDSNRDDVVNISDAVHTLGFLFLGGTQSVCPDAADTNDDGRLDISDPIGTLQFLFLGASAPPEPSGTPGSDPTEDLLHGCL